MAAAAWCAADGLLGCRDAHRRSCSGTADGAKPTRGTLEQLSRSPRPKCRARPALPRRWRAGRSPGIPAKRHALAAGTRQAPPPSRRTGGSGRASISAPCAAGAPRGASCASAFPDQSSRLRKRLRSPLLSLRYPLVILYTTALLNSYIPCAFAPQESGQHPQHAQQVKGDSRAGSRGPGPLRRKSRDIRPLYCALILTRRKPRWE